jgi:hypothetical protein
MSEQLLSEFVQAQASLRRSGYPSWYERVVAAIDAGQRESLDAALASPHITARAIATVLKGWGHNVSLAAVSNYRRRVHG